MNRAVLCCLLFVFASCMRQGPFVYEHELERRHYAKTDQLNIMCFNIRYDSPKDGQHAWPQRRDFVVEVLEKQQMDILCLQEVLYHQLKFIETKLPHYEVHGVGRKDAFRRGEFVPILYNKDRFAAVRSGHFWLSETPDQAGSKAWNANKPRMVSWVILCDYAQGEHQHLLVLNTHFDHRSILARENSTNLLIEKIQSLAIGMPVVVCGDFNMPSKHELHSRLCKETVPSLNNAHKDYQGVAVGTYHGFTGKSKAEPGFIDWVLLSAAFSVEEANVLVLDKDGQYLSDHHPLTVKLRYR